MSERRKYRFAGVVFLLALLARLVGVIVTIGTELNTYAQGDVYRFAASAKFIAAGLRDGTYVVSSEFSVAINTWARFLAPFWLFPGPSRIYARIGVTLLGAFAVYNVYLIARNLASQEAALVAVAPLLVYPSFIFIHSSILREAAVLFGITTTTRLLVVPPRRLHPLLTYTTAGGFLWFASIFRPENRPVFAAVLLIALVVKYRNIVLKTTLRYIAPLFAGTGFAAALVYLQLNTDWIASMRQSRARGRTEYLGYIFPESLASVVAFSWLGAIYFLFTPFPWMVAQLADFVAVFEALGNLVFAIFALTGVRTVFHRNPTVAVSLAAGIVLGAVLYGLATANVGTAIRHRQMLLWAIFIFGGIGMAERFDFTLSSDWWSTNHSELLDDGQSGTPADD